MVAGQAVGQRAGFPSLQGIKQVAQKVFSQSMSLPLRWVPNSWYRALMSDTLLRRTGPEYAADAVCFLYDCMVDVTGLTPEVLVNAYTQGIFPIATENGKIKWYDPDPRGILPFESFHVPRELGRIVRQGRFDITFDADFPAVIRACADRETTWIGPQIVAAYIKLHERGVAHSVEAWQDGELVGGLYGVAIGGLFVGESMFHRVRNAANVAFVHLTEHLRDRGFVLQDTQYPSKHMAQYGGKAIAREEYKERLIRALVTPASFG